MTSQINLHVEYLIPTYDVLVILLQSNLTQKFIALLAFINTIYWLLCGSGDLLLYHIVSYCALCGL